MNFRSETALFLGLYAVAAGASAIAVAEYPAHEASIALIFTAGVAAVTVGWTTLSGQRVDAEKEHSAALRTEFFSRVVYLVPTRELAPYTSGVPQQSLERMGLFVYANFGAPGPNLVARADPIEEFPCYSQVRSHARAYPDLDRAWSKAVTAVDRFNSLRDPFVEKVRVERIRVMKEKYSALVEDSFPGPAGSDYYNPANVDRFCIGRLFVEPGKYVNRVSDPRMSHPGRYFLTANTNLELVSSSGDGPVDVARFNETIAFATKDPAVSKDAPSVRDAMLKAEGAVADLQRELKGLSERLATGHRLRGSCEVGI